MARHLPEGWILEYKTIDKSGVKAIWIYQIFFLHPDYYIYQHSNHHRNLKISAFFKTINGFEYDENGVALGRWISNQRLAYNGKGNLKITEEQINLLEQIGMNFGNLI